MESITIRNNTRRVFTLPGRVGPDGEKFGGAGVAISPKSTLSIPSWYLEAMMEERSLAILFVEKKVDLLGPDGEVVRIQKKDLPPKRVSDPKFAAPESETRFTTAGPSSAELDAAHARISSLQGEMSELRALVAKLAAAQATPATSQADDKNEKTETKKKS